MSEHSMLCVKYLAAFIQYTLFVSRDLNTFYVAATWKLVAQHPLLHTIEHGNDQPFLPCHLILDTVELCRGSL